MSRCAICCNTMHSDGHCDTCERDRRTPCSSCGRSIPVSQAQRTDWRCFDCYPSVQEAMERQKRDWESRYAPMVNCIRCQTAVGVGFAGGHSGMCRACYEKVDRQFSVKGREAELKEACSRAIWGAPKFDPVNYGTVGVPAYQAEREKHWQKLKPLLENFNDMERQHARPQAGQWRGVTFEEEYPMVNMDAGSAGHAGEAGSAGSAAMQDWKNVPCPPRQDDDGRTWIDVHRQALGIDEVTYDKPAERDVPGAEVIGCREARVYIETDKEGRQRVRLLSNGYRILPPPRNPTDLEVILEEGPKIARPYSGRIWISNR